MSVSKKHFHHLPSKSYKFDKLRQPIRVELQKKYTNPETLTYFNYRPHEGHSHHVSTLADYIRSPLQKEQILARSYPTKASNSFVQVETNYGSSAKKTPEKIEKEMTKSFSGLKIRQNYLYLEQIILDLAQKKQFKSTRKYINHLQGQLSIKCQQILNRLQRTSLLGQRQFQLLQGLTKLYKICFPYDNVTDMSRQKMVRQLEKVLVKLVNPSKSTREQSREKIQKIKQDRKMINQQIEKQVQQLQKTFDNQRTKIKQNYESIYRKIYEENNKCKRQAEQAHKQLENERKQHEQFKIKYQRLFEEVTDQLLNLKDKCAKLKEESQEERKKREQMGQIIENGEKQFQLLKEEIEKVQNELKESNQKNQQHQKAAQKASVQSSKEKQELKKEIVFLKSQIEMQKSINSMLQETLQFNNRKNSANTLLFQLSQKSQGMQDEEFFPKKVKTQPAESLQEQKETNEFINVQIELKIKKAQLDSLNQQVRQIEEVYQNLKERLQDIQAKLSDINKEYEQKVYERDLADDERRDQEQKCKKLEQQEIQIATRMKQSHFRYLQLQKQIERMEKDKINVLNQASASKNAQIEDLSNIIHQKQQIIKQKQQQLTSLQQTIKQKTQYLSQLDKQVTSHLHQIFQLATQQSKTQQQQTQLLKNHTEIVSKVEQAQKQLQKLKKECQQTQKEINKLVLVLVRIESDKIMVECGMNQGKIDWVENWWKWMQESDVFQEELER